MTEKHKQTFHDIVMGLIVTAFLVYLGWLGNMVHNNSVSGGMTVQTVMDNKVLLLQLPKLRDRMNSFELQQVQVQLQVEEMDRRISNLEAKK